MEECVCYIASCDDDSQPEESEEMPDRTAEALPQTETEGTGDAFLSQAIGRRRVKSTYGTYFHVPKDKMVVDRVPEANSWTRWYLENFNGQVAFKTIHWPARFLRAQKDCYVNLAIHLPREWELWTPFKNENGSRSFVSRHRRWLSAREDGSIVTVFDWGLLNASDFPAGNRRYRVCFL